MSRHGPEDAPNHVEAEFAAAAGVLDAFRRDPANLARIDAVADALADAFRRGHKLLACGNGGSACDAMHLCEEFTGRFRADRPPLPAIACTDPGHITCTANDYGFDEVFARFVDALGKPGDVLIALSTSGNSENVVRAVQRARSRGLTTVALLGKGGGRLRGVADHEWIVPAPAAHAGRPIEVFADRIQEVHMLVLHVLIAAVERRLFPDVATPRARA